jgi:hypothetical protein
MSRDADNARDRLTTDRLDVAAFLLLRGFEPVSVEGSTRNITFVFSDRNGLAEAERESYFTGAQVVAVEFIRAQRRIKDLLWNKRRELEKMTRNE